MPYQIDEEVNIHIGVPTVRQTKLQGNGDIEVRAQAFSFSLHYRQRNQAPTVGERLLVAVLSGVHDEWLPSSKCLERGEEPRIDCELVSGEHYDEGASTLQRTGPDDMDALSFTHVQRGDTEKLHLAMTNRSHTKVYGAVVLDKRQAAQMLTALIAIYPRLKE